MQEKCKLDKDSMMERGQVEKTKVSLLNFMSQVGLTSHYTLSSKPHKQLSVDFAYFLEIGEEKNISVPIQMLLTVLVSRICNT